MSEDLAPDLLVVDEYQLLGDEQRGPRIRGDFGDGPQPGPFASDERKCREPSGGRGLACGTWAEVVLVSELRRPVPLEEVLPKLS